MGRKQKTKGIAETVNSVGEAKAAESTSVVGRSAAWKALSPRQQYEQDAIIRTAVMAFAEQPSQCARRLFSRQSGDEIVSGYVHEAVRKMITPSFIRETTSWWLIEGERVALKVRDATGVPTKLLPLDPGYLQPLPYNAKNLEQVTSWLYHEAYYVDGLNVSLEIPAELVMFSKGFNPNSHVRGLSPLVSCSLEASTNYFINRFNAAFFQNGTHRDLLVRFGRGTSKKTAEEWVNKWETRHSIFGGNAFRIGAFVGEDMEFIEPGQTAKDGQFLELRRANNDINAGVLGVPASLMGFYDRTRFDTVDAEEAIFFTYRLLPYVGDYSEWVQRQLIDPHFAKSTASRKKKAQFTSKAMRRAYEKAFDENPQSDVIFLLDPDVLPVAAKLRAKQLDNAAKYRTTMGTSYAVSAEWAGVDRDSNQLDEWVVIDNTQQVIYRPDVEVMPVAQPANSDANSEDPQDAPQDAQDDDSDQTDSEDTSEQKKRLGDAKAFFRAYRSFALESVANGKPFDKAQVRKLLAEHKLADLTQFNVQLASDHLALRAIQRDGTVEDQIKAAKEHFNKTMRPAHLRTLIKGDK